MSHKGRSFGTRADDLPGCTAVDVRTVGFAVSFRSCRAIQGGFLLLAMLCSYLVSDTWSLPSLSRSTTASSVSFILREGFCNEFRLCTQGKY